MNLDTTVVGLHHHCETCIAARGYIIRISGFRGAFCVILMKMTPFVGQVSETIFSAKPFQLFCDLLVFFPVWRTLMCLFSIIDWLLYCCLMSICCLWRTAYNAFSVAIATKVVAIQSVSSFRYKLIDISSKHVRKCTLIFIKNDRWIKVCEPEILPNVPTLNNVYFKCLYDFVSI